MFVPPLLIYCTVNVREFCREFKLGRGLLVSLRLDVDDAEEAVDAEPLYEPMATDDSALAAEGTAASAMEETD